MGEIIKAFYLIKKERHISEKTKQKVFDKALNDALYGFVYSKCMGKEPDAIEKTIVDSRKFSSKTIDDNEHEHVSVPVWLQHCNAECLAEIAAIEKLPGFVMWTDENLIEQIKQNL